MVAGNQQGVLGSGESDVEQPALLVDAALQQLVPVGADDVFEGLAVVDSAGVQQRHPVQAGLGSVPAQQRGKVSRVVEPGASLRRRREQPRAQVRYRDDLPFQTLGGVDGEHLNPPGRNGDLGRGQPVLHRRGGVEIGQQSGHVGVGPLRVAGDHVGEPVQVFGAGPRGAHLGVDPEDSADLGDQVDQRVRQEAAQPGQFGTQGGDAPMPLGGIALGRSRIGQGVSQARAVGGGGGGDVFGRLHGRGPPVQLHRTAPQRNEVGGPQPPARAREHLHRGGARGGVGDQPEHRDRLRDLRDRQQPGQAHHLDRDPARRQRRRDRPGVGVAAHQHRGGDPFGVALGDPVSHPVPFGLHVAVQRAQHGAGVGVRPGPQRTDRHRAAASLGGDRVGQSQRPGRVAPAGTQLQGGRRGAIREREIGGEPRQVGGRGTPPAVDGLDRVTHGGQRQPAVDAATEEGRQRDPLGMPGVLVFVEQHHPVAGTEFLTDLRAPHGQTRGRGHLGAEVHHLGLPHPGVQGVDEWDQRRAIGLGVEHVQQPPVGSVAALAGPRRQGVHQPLELDVGVAQLGGVDEVLGQFVGQLEHHLGHRGGRLGDVQRPGVAGDDLVGQLPALGLAEQPSVRFDRQQGSELAQQPPGEGVIGAHLRGTRDGLLALPQEPGEPGQPGAHPAQQLPGGLAGEGQAEHLARIGVPVGHQPHHPGGHGLGLAGPCAGDDHQRAGRSGDDRGLLVGGRRKAKGGSKFGGAVRHEDGPPWWAGHDGCSGQCEQPELTRAAKCGPAVAAAAARTSRCRSEVSSGPSAVCSRSVAAPAAEGLPR